MKILITGATGFIGKYLSRQLAQKGHQICPWPGSDQLDLSIGRDVDFFMRGRTFDAVIHCAARGSKDPRSTDWSILDTNLQMYYNLLSYKDSYTRFISIGSGAEFSMTDTPYGLSKRVIRTSMLNLEGFYNLRVYGVFSEEELESRFIKANILRYLEKKPIQIHQDRYMDFMYVEDLLKIVEHYLDSNDLRSEADCVYPYTYKLSKIADIINSLGSHKVEVHIHKGGIGEGYCAFGKAPDLPYIGLTQGITNVYNKLK